MLSIIEKLRTNEDLEFEFKRLEKLTADEKFGGSFSEIYIKLHKVIHRREYNHIMTLKINDFRVNLNYVYYGSYLGHIPICKVNMKANECIIVKVINYDDDEYSKLAKKGLSKFNNILKFY